MVILCGPSAERALRVIKDSYNPIKKIYTGRKVGGYYSKNDHYVAFSNFNGDCKVRKFGSRDSAISWVDNERR